MRTSNNIFLSSSVFLEENTELPGLFRLAKKNVAGELFREVKKAKTIGLYLESNEM